MLAALSCDTPRFALFNVWLRSDHDISLKVEHSRKLSKECTPIRKDIEECAGYILSYQ
jgi:hypothetical protein